MTSTSLKLRKATATLETYNQSPRKVRLVTNLVKGKKVSEAIAALEFLPKRAAEPVQKLIKSAVANAKNNGEKGDDFIVSNMIVESGEIIKRYMPRAFGRASLIRRRRSRVKVLLTPVEKRDKKSTKKSK